MRVDFNPDQDSVAQAQVLVGALTAWLAEQPEQAPQPGEAHFTYRADGSLDSITTVPVDEA